VFNCITRLTLHATANLKFNGDVKLFSYIIYGVYRGCQVFDLLPRQMNLQRVCCSKCPMSDPALTRALNHTPGTSPGNNALMTCCSVLCQTFVRVAEYPTDVTMTSAACKNSWANK